MKKLFFSFLITLLSMAINAQVLHSPTPLTHFKSKVLDGASGNNTNQKTNAILFKPCREVDSDWDPFGNQWFFSDSIRNSYNSSGNITLKLSYHGSSTDPEKNRYVYNGNGKLIADTGLYWNGSSYMMNSLNTYLYDVNGNKTQEIHYNNWSGSSWLNGAKRDYTYDVNDNQIQSLTQDWNGTAWANSYKDSYTWNAGVITQQLSQSWNGTAWDNAYRADYLHTGGQLSTLTSYLWNGTTWNTSSKFNNIIWYQWAGFFNEDSKLLSYTEQVPNGSLWKDTIKLSLTYDSYGNQTDYLYQSKPGATFITVDEFKNFYQYNGNNSITEDIQQNWNASTQITENYKKREYSDFYQYSNSSCVPSQPGTVSGNTSVTPAAIETYSVAPVSGATSYSWTLPAGYSGTSTSNSINITIGNASGVISVVAQNSCGISLLRNLSLTVNTSTMSAATVKSIAGGSGHTLLVCSDNSLWAFGYNYFGQLGDGTNSSTRTPVLINSINDIKAVAGSGLHSIVLKNDGTVWTFGKNNSGQLGRGNLINSNIPVQVTALSNIIEIAVGYQHSLAVKNDGTVWAWGRNDNGQLGIGNYTDQSVPYQISSLTNVRSVSAGFDHSLVLKNDGTVWAFGRNPFGQLGNGSNTISNTPVNVTNLSGIIGIAAGYQRSIALKNNGTVWAWGRNDSGEHGDGTTNDVNIPVQTSVLNNITKIVTKEGASFALKSDGTVWAWGSNSSSELGIGTTSYNNVPLNIPSLTNISDIETGIGHCFAVNSTGSVWAWGSNSDGEIGNGSTTNVYPTPVAVTGFCGTQIGITEIDQNNSVTIFPNPTTGVFQIKSNHELQNATIKIYNTRGQTIFESTQFVEEIDLTTQPKGMYFVQINSEGKIAHKKIVVQ